MRPQAKIIGFPRAATTAGIGRFAAATDVDAISVDTAGDLPGLAAMPGLPVLQGNLDPLALVAGGDGLDRAVDAILAVAAERPLVFNLGHGILPETPIANVERMLARVRG